jgi:hypothetical protein
VRRANTAVKNTRKKEELEVEVKVFDPKQEKSSD